MKVEIKFAGLAGLCVLGIIFYALTQIESWLNPLQWFLQASVLWCWVWRETWHRCKLNRISMDTPLLEHLGWANRLTLLRGYLIALTSGFLFQPQAQGFMSLVPGLLYGLAAILDRVDGFIARKTKEITLLGAALDTVFDALGLLVMPLLAVGYGKIHWSYLLLSIAYPIFKYGSAWREKRGLPVYAIMPSQLRRALAGFQMGFIALALLPWFYRSQTLICSLAFVLPVLVGFIVDWLVVSGRIKSQSPGAQHFFTRLKEFSIGILQPALRIFVAIGLLYFSHQMGLSLASTDHNILFSLGLLFGTSLVLTGWAGRIGVLVILCLLSSHPIAINSLSVAILFSSTWLLLFGTGRLSLWQWDDVWVNRQDGA
jgi:CDP-diacylglycerol--glycerol-3-phosphate 3-phosphatidyltransferase